QEVLLEFLKIDEFTTAGIRFFEAQSSMLLQCEVFHIIAADGTAHGVDFEDGFNNGNQVIGGEIHSCSNGVYIGAGAVQNSVCTTIEGCSGIGLIANSCSALYVKSYFELNTLAHIQVANSGSYDAPARSLHFDSCHFSSSQVVAQLYNAAGVVLANIQGDPPALGSAPDYITLGAGAQNVRVLGESYVAIRNDNGTPVRPPEASYLEENEYTHSAAWADASWGKSANVVTVENSATDGTKFIDGTAPMHVVVSG